MEETSLNWYAEYLRNGKNAKLFFTLGKKHTDKNIYQMMELVESGCKLAVNSGYSDEYVMEHYTELKFDVE